MVARIIPSRAAVALVATALATTPLHAQSPRQPVTITGHFEPGVTQIVPFQDLSLVTEAGQRALMGRVKRAVGEVCSYEDAAWTIRNPAIEECKSYAWAGARPQMRQAIDLARSGQTLAMSISVTGRGQ